MNIIKYKKVGWFTYRKIDTPTHGLEIEISSRYFTFFGFKSWFWIRIFGYGFRFKDTSIHDLTFSERYKKRKDIRIGDWSFKLLTKNDYL